MSTLKRFFRDTIIYGIAAVLPRAINIVLVKLHTNTLVSSSYADSTIYFVYAAYFNALLTYGMETAFFRFFTAEKEKGKVISTAFLTLLGTTLAFMSLALFYSDELSAHMGFTSPLALKILILVTTFDTLLVIPFAYLRVTNRPIKFTFYKVLNVVIFAIFNLYFLLYVPNALEYGNYVPGFLADHFHEQPLVLYIFIANLMGSMITFLLLFPLVFKFKLNYDKALLYKMLGYGLPIMISSLAYVTNENLDKLLLTRYLGKEQMGIYAACYKLGVFMSLYIMAFKMGAEPFFFNQADKSNAKETYSRVMNWFVIFGSLFMIIIVCFIDLFGNLLLGRPVYFSALEIVPVILLANLFLGIYYNLSVWFKLTDKTRYGMYFSIFGAALTIGLNIVFIPKYGYMASAWATLATYMLVALLSYLYGRKFYRIPYNLSINFFSLITAAAGSFISFYYFRANYLASVAIVLIFLTGIIMTQKTEIKKIWKT
ncbi:MAG: polysaccharide biosynthesis C-terminal domain-containing protein [Flavobacteriaceae bacterium]|nr:MAG: polysaccharide biosynthesis C-terminal domain-containing protein [Flavobacteriaceae bacterium]